MRGFFIPARRLHLLRKLKRSMASADQKFASWLSNKMGGAWFWLPPTRENPLAVSSFISTYLNRCDPVWCNVAPNLPPNRDGLIQDTYVAWLKQLGQSYTHLPRAPASFARAIWTVITAIGATRRAILRRALCRWRTERRWVRGPLHAIAMDLVGALPSRWPLTSCGVLQHRNVRLFAETDRRQDTGGFDSSQSLPGTKFITALTIRPLLRSRFQAVYRTWTGDNTLKYAMFTPVHARYMRLEATAVRSGSAASVSEVDFGDIPWAGADREHTESHFAPANRPVRRARASYDD